MPSMAEAAKIRDVAERHAYVFDNGLSSPDFFDLEKRMASEEFALFDRIGLDEDVLEVGCLTGLNLLGLEKRGHTGRLHGVDFVPASLDWCKSQSKDVLLIGLTFPGPLMAGAQYDSVICFDVLEHQLNVGQFLEGVVNVLAPGGQALFLVPIGKAYNDCGHVAWFPDEECLRNVLDYHFEVESVRRLETCDKMFAICTRRK